MQLQACHSLQQLVESLYQSPGQWAVFLEQLTRLTYSRSSRLLVLDDKASTVQSSIKHNIDDNYHDQYVRHYVNTCPWRPELANFPEGQIYSTFLDFSCKQQAFYQTEFFNEWAKPQDIHHGVCGTVFNNGKQKVQLLSQRSHGQGHYSEHDKVQFNQLMPHLRRAIMLQMQLEMQQLKSHAICEARELSPLPMILLDQSGCVSYLSRSAESWLKQQQVIHIHRKRIELKCDLASQHRFERLLNDCLNSASGVWDRAGGWFQISCQHKKQTGLLLMPLHPEMEVPMFSAGQFFAAIFIYDALSRVSLCHETLKALYSVTPAETQLLQALVHGETLEDYAEHCKRSLYTVKAQLRSLFRKTGTGRQASLICKVMSSPANLGIYQPVLNL